MKKLSHYDAAGQARMVDVGSKAATVRTARAHAFVRIAPKVLKKLPENPKGNPLEVARFAGIMAAKRTAELIPLCHPLPLTFADVEATVEKRGVRIVATARTAAQTGVEMEALTAAAVAALTVYDMSNWSTLLYAWFRCVLLKKQSSMLMSDVAGDAGAQAHPLRAIKKLADEALAKLSPVFDAMYATGRPASDPARAAAEVDAADGAVLGAPRAAALRAARLQPVFRWFLGTGLWTFSDGEDLAAMAREALEGWLEAHLVDGKVPPRPVEHRAPRGVSVANVTIRPGLAAALRIRWARRDSGLSQTELGKLASVSQQQIAKLESPDENPSLETLSKVAHALGLEVSVGLERPDTMPSVSAPKRRQRRLVDA